jgi:opacity protein-like surface antigen
VVICALLAAPLARAEEPLPSAAPAVEEKPAEETTPPAEAAPAPAPTEEETKKEDEEKKPEEKKEGEAAGTESAPATETPPATEIVPGTVAPAPAPEPVAVPAPVTPAATVTAEKSKEPEKPWSATFSIEPGASLALRRVGTVPGADPTLDSAKAWIPGDAGLGFAAQGSYTIMPKLSASAAFGFAFDLTGRPESNRAVELQGLLLRVDHAELYKDPTTEITVKANASWTPPQTVSDFSYNPTAGTLGAGIALARPVGPVNLSLSLGGSKSLYLNPTVLKQCSYVSDGTVSSCPEQRVMGWNRNFGFQTALAASYTWEEKLSVSASFGVSWSKTLATDEVVNFDNPNNPESTADRFGFAFVAGASYQIDEHLAVALSYANQRPQRTNGQDIFGFTERIGDTTQLVDPLFQNPFIDKRFASMGLSLSYSL